MKLRRSRVLAVLLLITFAAIFLNTRKEERKRGRCYLFHCFFKVLFVKTRTERVSGLTGGIGLDVIFLCKCPTKQTH